MIRQIDEEEEVWAVIPEFPHYHVSNLGNIYNARKGHPMRVSVNNFGHTKISLKSHLTHDRYTRSVAQIVAEAFVEAPTPICDQVVVLDGDLRNVAANNLVWRPAGFAWEYSRQLKVPQPLHYRNLTVLNIVTSIVYSSIIEAGMQEGLLFKDIWRSTYTGEGIFPYSHVFEVIE